MKKSNTITNLSMTSLTPHKADMGHAEHNIRR